MTPQEEIAHVALVPIDVEVLLKLLESNAERPESVAGRPGLHQGVLPMSDARHKEKEAHGSESDGNFGFELGALDQRIVFYVRHGGGLRR